MIEPYNEICAQRMYAGHGGISLLLSKVRGRFLVLNKKREVILSQREECGEGTVLSAPRCAT
jgi:hypothetical protein